MPDFPTSITFGRVVGRYLLALADGSDTDETPDVVAAVGSITLKPIATEIDGTGVSPAIVVPAEINCSLDANGVLTGPNGNPGVWVVTGEYKVVPSVQNASGLSSFDIVVEDTHTGTSPLDLALAAPLQPAGQQVFVVNEQVYVDTLAARDAAIAASQAAQGATDAGVALLVAPGATGATATALAARVAGYALAKASNLSDLASASAARMNLGLGTASTHAATDFDPAGAAAAVTLAGLGGVTAAAAAQATAQSISALKLGTASTHAATDFDPAGAAAAVTTAQAAVNASKADLVGGVIPTSQIPALALVSSRVVASQAEMLALTASQVQPGDLAVRTDGAGTFILSSSDPSQLANWTPLNAPTDVVTSVNGQQGTVVLNASNVGADPAGAATAAVAGLAPLASPAFTGAPTVPTAAPGTSTTQAASTAFVAAAVRPATEGVISYLGTNTDSAYRLTKYGNHVIVTTSVNVGANGGNNGAAFATLPVGYRPASTVAQVSPVYASGTGYGSHITAFIEIASTGAMTFAHFSAAPGASAVVNISAAFEAAP